MGSFRFNQWAMHVNHRGWAFLSVVLHRLQRMTVLSPSAWVGHERATLQRVHHIPGHRVIRDAECVAFDRATRSEV